MQKNAANNSTIRPDVRTAISKKKSATWLVFNAALLVSGRSTLVMRRTFVKHAARALNSLSQPFLAALDLNCPIIHSHVYFPPIQDVKQSGIRAPANGVVHWRCGNGAQSKRQELAESGPEPSRCVVAEFGGSGSQAREP
jgi:hypothetical protein